MVYENNNKRIHWLTISLNAIPDILIAVIIAAVMKGGVATAVVVFLALQLVYPLLWLRNALVRWVLLFSSRKDASNAWKWGYLRANGYPEPDDNEHSAEAYLSSIIENVSLPEDMRLKAAFDLGAINAIHKDARQISHASHYEDVVARYKTGMSKDVV